MGRTALLATVGAGVAAAAVLVAVLVVLVMQRSEDPGSARDDSGNEPTNEGTSGTSGTFTQEAPWRLRIRDAIYEVSGGADVGCDVMLTNEESDNVRNWDDFYGTKTFQMRESGTFRYEVNDPGCLLLPQRGDGGTSRLPFTWSAFNGDTPVFESPGAVEVRVENRHGTSTCDLWLMNDSDGRAIDSREVAKTQASVLLESNGPGRVFIAAATCSIRVSAPP